MADFEPPSFSLGLDLDSQGEHRELSPIRSPNLPAALQDRSVNAGVRCTEGQDGLHELENEEVMDSDPEPEPESTRIFKRLKRGLGAGTPSTSAAAVKERGLEDTSCDNGDDDIEDFSSQEDLLVRVVNPETQYHSLCSSSKIPLRGSGILTSQSTIQRKASKQEPGSDVPSSSKSAASHDGFMFPKLTVSPLRRFQLLDSDSDDEDLTKTNHKIDPRSSEKSGPTTSVEKRKVSEVFTQNDDLWKDFGPNKNARVPTPMLDEICEEYFSSVKGKNVTQNVATGSCGSLDRGFHPIEHGFDNIEKEWHSSDSTPPAHRYFFHSDPRIQKLVRSRLPNFCPLGTNANRRNQHSGASVIDYTSQFSNGKASRQNGTQKVINNKSSSRGRGKSNKSKAEDVLHASEGWVAPKSSAPIPKDAGKRRVHASGQSAGHWYTSPEGRKVYISKTGQELTGQVAYRQYKKDSGGPRKSKKKTSGKKKKAKS